MSYFEAQILLDAQGDKWVCTGPGDLPDGRYYFFVKLGVWNGKGPYGFRSKNVPDLKKRFHPMGIDDTKAIIQRAGINGLGGGG